jgi:hypothetical protein
VYILTVMADMFLAVRVSYTASSSRYTFLFLGLKVSSFCSLIELSSVTVKRSCTLGMSFCRPFASFALAS